MDAQESGRVEPRLEIGDGLIDAVFAAVDGGIGKLIARHKVRHGVEVEEGDAFAHAGGNAARVIDSLTEQRRG